MLHCDGFAKPRAELGQEEASPVPHEHGS